MTQLDFFRAPPRPAPASDDPCPWCKRDASGCGCDDMRDDNKETDHG